LNESTAAPIPGTLTNPGEPVFAPDGTSIAFWANGMSAATDATGKIWRVPLTGGTPTPVCDAPAPYGMSWTGSRIYFGTLNAIMAVSDTGGTPTELVKADAEKKERLGHPQASLDGRWVIFVVNLPNKGWDTSQIVAQDVASGERRALVSGGTSPRLLKSGHLAFYRENTVFAQRFDERTATLSGTAVPMVLKASFASFSGAGTSPCQSLALWRTLKAAAMTRLNSGGLTGPGRQNRSRARRSAGTGIRACRPMAR
jgi:Tol biopolymer transport system component